MIKRNFILLFCTLFFTLTSFADSRVIALSNFSDIKKIIMQTKEPRHVLLALDDDDTLTMMPCASAQHCQYLGGPAWFTWQSHLPANDKSRVWKTFPQLLNIANFLYTSSKMVLVDPAIPSALAAADSRSMNMMVITDRGYRMVDATENQFLHDHLLKIIEKNAIKINGNHISHPGFYFPIKWNKETPRRIAYVHGILYDAGQNKGEMIKQFLAKTNEKNNIHTIIFVDDTLKNVNDVARAYQNNSVVNAICIHYTRLHAHKQAFLTGKNAQKLQALATQQWFAIRTTLQKNLIGFNL